MAYGPIMFPWFSWGLPYFPSFSQLVAIIVPCPFIRHDFLSSFPWFSWEKVLPFQHFCSSLFLSLFHFPSFSMVCPWFFSGGFDALLLKKKCSHPFFHGFHEVSFISPIHHFSLHFPSGFLCFSSFCPGCSFSRCHHLSMTFRWLFPWFLTMIFPGQAPWGFLHFPCIINISGVGLASTNMLLLIEATSRELSSERHFGIDNGLMVWWVYLFQKCSSRKSILLV